MKWNRFYAFGCSYTKYEYPTWADIIGKDLQIPYENWGARGGGNYRISVRMLECDLQHNITKEDLILVNWASWWREDRITKYGNWTDCGSIFNSPSYSTDFVKTYWNSQNDIVKNCAAIISSNKIYPIAYQSHMLDYENNIFYSPSIIKKYQYLLTELPEKNIFDDSKNSQFDMTTDDKHPDVLCHLSHALKIYGYLGLKMKSDTIEWCNDLQNEIISKNSDKYYHN